MNFLNKLRNICHEFRFAILELSTETDGIFQTNMLSELLGTAWWIHPERVKDFSRMVKERWKYAIKEEIMARGKIK